MGTPNREPQQYSRNIIEYKDPGRYILIILLLLSGEGMTTQASTPTLSRSEANQLRARGPEISSYTVRGLYLECQGHLVSRLLMRTIGYYMSYRGYQPTY